MSEFGGPESFTPGEGSGPASEQVSEQAKERFAQAQQQIKQIIKEEKKAKKRDDRVAATIKQFLGDDRYSHLFQLISRLAALDCPSVFILAILSLIHEGSLNAVEDYIREQNVIIKSPGDLELSKRKDGLPPEARRDILMWTTRLELVMNIDAEKILGRLMVDEGNIDGSVLQLSTFVLIDYFTHLKRVVTYEELQPLTIKILQDIIEPHVGLMEERFRKMKEEQTKVEEDD